jgi:hypothetical protein
MNTQTWLKLILATLLLVSAIKQFTFPQAESRNKHLIGSYFSNCGLCIALVLAAFATIHPVSAQEWIQLTPSPDPTNGTPRPSQGHVGVYNPATNRMMIFGGELDTPASHILGNEVWVLTHADGSDGTAAWIKLNPNPDPTNGLPSPRGHTSGVYDKTNNQMIIYGGDPNVGNCNGAVNDTWILENADGSGATPQWRKLNTSGTPPNIRQSPSVAYDDSHNNLIVFGGLTNACGGATNTVWLLSVASATPTWTNLSTSTPQPTPRVGNSNVFDQLTSRLITFGGNEEIGVTSDAWILSQANGTGVWTRLSPNGILPSPRSSHTAVYDEKTNRMIVFGGSAPYNDVWVLDKANGVGGEPTWLQLNPTGSLPQPRYMHSAVYNPTTQRMVVFGGTLPPLAGEPQGKLANDVWVLTDANGIFEITVALDIRPGSATNPINLKSKGKIPIAILSSATFNAVDIDTATVRFGHSGTEATVVQSSIEDVNDDGYVDMMLHFNTQETGIQCTDTSAVLKGKTFHGQDIIGTDVIKTNGCNQHHDQDDNHGKHDKHDQHYRN